MPQPLDPGSVIFSMQFALFFCEYYDGLVTGKCAALAHFFMLGQFLSQLANQEIGYPTQESEYNAIRQNFGIVSKFLSTIVLLPIILDYRRPFSDCQLNCNCKENLNHCSFQK